MGRDSSRHRRDAATFMLAAGAALALAAFTQSEARAGTAPERLPASTVRGPIDELRQYPTLSVATASERAAAQALLRRIVAASARWRRPADAKAAGYEIVRARRRPGDASVHFLHAEHGSFGRGHSYLDPSEPKALIYANFPRPFPLRLVGVMFSVPRGVRGQTPGGPITRWHTHTVCARPGARGLAPGRDGNCPPGTSRKQGSEMMHVWFTGDLRSAFSTRAPTKELRLDRLPPTLLCYVDP